MTTRKSTITIGIPAFNEGRNLCQLLPELLNQNYSGLKLEKIIISSDGSNDSTRKVVKSLKDSKIKLFDNHDRKGKSRGLNQIINSTTSDILVLLDADIVIKDKNLIEKLTLPLLRDDIQLTSGSLKELESKSFIGKTISLSMQLKGNIFNNLNSGNNIFHCHGPVRAFSKKLYSSIQFPPMAGDDMYSYLYCIKNGYKFAFVKPAAVYYQPPENFTDHNGQSLRYFQSINSYKKLFGKDFVTAYTSIPLSAIAKGLLNSLPILIVNPIKIITYFVILFILKIKSLSQSDITDKWKIADSSKISINI